VTSPFEVQDHRDLIALIDAYPLAWIVPFSDPATALPMPILAETDGDGRLTSLLGHIPKRSPLVERIGRDPRTLFLFSGPHAYISPEYVATTRNWGPTWNFAIVKIVADVALDEVLNDEALERLVAKMEKGRPQPWSVQELGSRYEQLKQRIIGFRAPVVSVDGRFKLGQDEAPEVLESILRHLEGSEIAEWMTRFSQDRTR
jgi:transcriptional regulator